MIREIHHRSLWQVLGIYLAGSAAVLGGAGTLADALRLPDWFVPLALGLLVVGLPIVLATAVVQEGGPEAVDEILGDDAEATPEDVGAVPQSAPARLFTWRNALLGGVGALALWGVVAAGWVLMGGTPATPPTGALRPSIAVLPFENLSPDPEHEYFASGLYQEISTQLARVASLRVISTRSVAGFASTSTVGEIAGALSVGTLLDGDVQVLGDRLRVNVRLVDGGGDEVLWANQYNAVLSDVFAIQSDIASQIVSALSLSLTPSETTALETAPTESSEAYALYLRGKEYWERPAIARADVEAAIDLFQRAVDLDPEFALAWAWLSYMHSAMTWRGYFPPELNTEERRAAAVAAAREALRLDPDLPEAHMAQGYVLYYVEYDLNAALEELEIAQRARPSDVDIMEARGFVHRRLGNWDEAIQIFEEAVAISPRDYDLWQNMGGNTFDLVGRKADAIRALRQAFELAPERIGLQATIGLRYLEAEGQLDSLRAVAARLPPDHGVRYTLAYYERDWEGMLRFLEDMGADVSRDALLYSRLGDEARAQAALDSIFADLGAVPESERDLDWYAQRGSAYASAGRGPEAAADARTVAGWWPDDEYSRLGVELNALYILGRAGLVDEACDLIERMLAEPSPLTVHMLRLDADFDPIRESPRFQAIVARYPPGVAR